MRSDVMRKQLAQGLVVFMTRERKLPGYRFNYGIGGTNISADGRTIHLTFVFRRARRYCCAQSGCHHGLLFEADYARLRNCFGQMGVVVPRPMTVYMKVVCEGGSRSPISRTGHSFRRRRPILCRTRARPACGPPRVRPPNQASSNGRSH
jgi:hypothetical protein